MHDFHLFKKGSCTLSVLYYVTLKYFAHSVGFSVTEGDYVYLECIRKGKGQKLQPLFIGPYVIEEINSPHLVTLRNAESNKCIKLPVHCDRLKMAYVREPHPIKYFPATVVTSKSPSTTNMGIQTDDLQLMENVNEVTDEKEEAELTEAVVESVNEPQGRRTSSRKKQQTERFGIPITLEHSSLSSDSDGYHQVKRILGMRRKGTNSEYLVQLRGEPAQNAFWAPFSHLNSKAQAKVLADRAIPL